MHTKLWLGNLNGRDHSEEVGVDEKRNIKTRLLLVPRLRMHGAVPPFPIHLQGVVFS